MYKMLMFLKQSDDQNVLKHFRDFTLPVLRDLMGKDVKAAKVESSLLIEQKYTWYCEVAVNSKYEWDRMMTSKEGKRLNKDLMDFHQSIDLIFVNFEEEI
ncbi:MAG TPA: EthD family reductase [Ignavibacteriaceae bacterium]|jgi:uncharacterized protein (TIGR02118 family)|nr:EthD family reductase [Ignavibacteriaceae bacterium]